VGKLTQKKRPSRCGGGGKRNSRRGRGNLNFCKNWTGGECLWRGGVPLVEKGHAPKNRPQKTRSKSNSCAPNLLANGVGESGHGGGGYNMPPKVLGGTYQKTFPIVFGGS